MQIPKSAGNRRITIWIFSITALLLFTFCSSHAQVFPLQTKENSSLLTSRNGKSFLVYGSDLKTNLRIQTDLAAQLDRLQQCGVNTILYNVSLQGKVRPGAKLRQTKMLTRETISRKMALFVTLNDINANDSLFYSELFRKTARFKNIIWISKDEQSARSLSSNPDQLKGYIENTADSVSSIQFLKHFEHQDSTRNVRIRIFPARFPETESSVYKIRRDIFSGILNGEAGLILSSDFLGFHTNKQSVTLASQLNLLKLTLESLSWESFTVTNTLIPENYGKNSIVSTISDDRSASVIYIPAFTTFSINLSVFSSPVSLEWTNPETGSKFSQTVDPEPSQRLFFPPVSQPSNDWLLTIRSTGN